LAIDTEDDGIAPPAPDAGADIEERVGYAKPPRHTRFKPGQSGNRKGRPKGAEARKTIVNRVATERHRVIEQGKPRWRSTLELVVLAVCARAVAGDARAFPTFHDLLVRFGVEEPNHRDAPYILMPEALTAEELEKEAEKSREQQQKLKESYEARLRSEPRSLHRRRSR
jgi:hypothetical protein